MFYQLFQFIADWSEVWALLIPISVLLLTKKRPPSFLKPVILYVFAAFAINLFADIIATYKHYLPSWLQSNNPLYNIHSIIRFVCFSYFFIAFKSTKGRLLKLLLPLAFISFFVVNFTGYEKFLNPNRLSGGMLAVEAFLLLAYCLQYYLIQLQDDVESIADEKHSFWVVTGLSCYVVINFFLFLFYVPMITENPALAIKMWDVHNVAYILFCILIAKAFYVPSSNQS